MAFAYPEGECFFRRSSLKNSFFSAEKPADFYSYMLVEYVWNQPFLAVAKDINQYKHPRAGLNTRSLEGNPFIGNYPQLPIMYGPRYNDIKRYYQHDLCVDEAVFRKRLGCGGSQAAAAEPFLMMVPMPTREERWIWFDQLAHIRAIYIPAAQQTDQQYKHLCTYLQINFTLKASPIPIWNAGKSQMDTYRCDKIFGLGIKAEWTTGIDVQGIQLFLGLPRKLRNANVYSAHLVCCVHRSLVRKDGQRSFGLLLPKNQPPPKEQLSHNNDLPYLDVLNASTGLELQWKPYIPTPTNNWVGDTLKNLITAALGMIPEVGLLAQIAFTLAWTGITDFDSFVITITSTLPGVQALTPAVIEAMRKDTTEMKRYLPPDWDKVGAPFQTIASQTIPGVARAKGVDPNAPQTNPDGTDQGATFVKGQKRLEKSPTAQPSDPPPPPDDV